MSYLNTILCAYGNHADIVRAVAWSPDGKSIASASNDGTVQIWNTSTGHNILTYCGHTGEVTSLAWSPDGKYIASGGTDGLVHIWDTDYSNHILTYEGHSSRVNTVAWAPNGKYIASGSGDGTVQVWDAITASTTLTYTYHNDEVRAVDWSPTAESEKIEPLYFLLCWKIATVTKPALCILCRYGEEGLANGLLQRFARASSHSAFEKVSSMGEKSGEEAGKKSN
jgi:tricorn protease-like protein